LRSFDNIWLSPERRTAMMSKQQLSHSIPPEVERVRRGFERWRRTRKKRSPIPERLWQAAVQVAESYGVNKTARTLGLDYYELKKRLKSGAGVPGVEKGGMGSFVELVGVVPAVGGECVVEVESASGTKLRVHLRGRPEVGWLRGLLYGGEEG
jgi:hypothetical protein